MTSVSSEQARHDQINLGRIVRRLDSSTRTDEWNEGVAEEIWIRAKAALQRVKYARQLLKSVALDEFQPSSSSSRHNDDLAIKLDRVEQFMKEVEIRLAPKSARPKSLLSRMPTPLIEDKTDETKTPRHETFDTLNAATEDVPPIATDDLLLSPADKVPPPVLVTPMPVLIPSTLPSGPTKSTTTASASGAFLQNSQALHHDLSDQLAQMATQLRRNAVHFSETLAKDQALVKEAEEKLEGNFDVMKRERVRLRDHSGKSGSTTCLVIASVIGSSGQSQLDNV
ncbi:hypothetical protein HGRIS_003161 [Hohenbuehelia grisea]|uniref:Uncharacterized protein n=1 Tax=Hohenbuehelia grisea TaxID=104357 RepID=A0ABR3JMM5_9AGAR